MLADLFWQMLELAVAFCVMCGIAAVALALLASCPYEDSIYRTDSTPGEASDED